MLGSDTRRELCEPLAGDPVVVPRRLMGLVRVQVRDRRLVPLRACEPAVQCATPMTSRAESWPSSAMIGFAPIGSVPRLPARIGGNDKLTS